MRLRIADRVLVALAGLILLACCAGLVAQLFFGVDLLGLATRVFTSENPNARIALISLAVFLLLLGLYCFFVLFRHRSRRDKFILQKNDGGELAISIKALENMIQKCLDQHEELEVKQLFLENRKDGLLIRIRSGVAGGISIPLTVESLQRQIRQYVTACSGVEIRGVRVEIESSGPDAKDAPFAIAAPAGKPLLREAAEKPAALPMEEPAPLPQEPPTPAESAAQEEASESIPAKQEPAKPAPAPMPPMEEEEDDRPLHQRLFSRKPEPCIIPEPPEESQIPESPEESQVESLGEEAPTQDATPEGEPALDEANVEGEIRGPGTQPAGRQ